MKLIKKMSFECKKKQQKAVVCWMGRVQAEFSCFETLLNKKRVGQTEPEP